MQYLPEIAQPEVEPEDKREDADEEHDQAPVPMVRRRHLRLLPPPLNLDEPSAA